MSENKNTTITKEKAISFASAVSIIALCWALYTGVLDRGTSAGSMNEKVVTFEKQLTKLDTTIGEVIVKLESQNSSGHSNQIDIVKLQAIVEQLKLETRETRRIVDDIRDRQLRGPN